MRTSIKDNRYKNKDNLILHHSYGISAYFHEKELSNSPLERIVIVT